MSIAREIVGFAMDAGSSDIHLEEDSPIAVRINSDIKVSPQKLDSTDMDELLLELLGEEKLNEFNQKGDLDSSIGLEGLSRLRINAYVANEKRCLTLRLLPNDLPKWQDLGLPDAFIKLSKLHRGLVLCTGPTGSGKSLIATAMIYKCFAECGVAYMTAPIKALVSEKFFSLCRTFGAENVGMMTGDGAVNRDAPIIVCTAEILSNLSLREGERRGTGNPAT